MAADRMSKKAKLDRGLSHSPNPITSPLVWAPAKKQYRTFDYYPLISNEIDDRHALDGWNACIATDPSGGPLYRLKATGKGTKESMIVTLKQSIALRYPGATVETFHRNNILLFDTKTLPLTWSLDSLRAIGNVDLVQEVQDHQQRSSEETKEYIHVNVSLGEMYEEGLLEEGRILNALSLPRNTSHSDHPLQSIISSDIRAFEQTSNLPTDIYTPGYPVSATSFWLVATKGAINYIHPDCFGVGTVVEVLCGWKLWYVFQHRRTVGNRQDSYIDEYMGDWAPGFIPDPKDWTAEVVLLEPGSAFYMHPDTHHAVVTLENSIVKGHHFYSTATLSKTVSGWVHMCMLGYSITNVLHTELLEVLLHMMCYFGATISGEGPERHDTDILSVEREGLLDLIALGNLCLFAPALYTCICDERESLRPAIAMAAGAYISIIQRLRTRYCLIFFEEDAKVAAHAPESMMCVDGVSLRVASLDIANFARTSAAHFGRSLIFYAGRALRQEKASGQHESLWIDFKQFRQDIEDSMHTYLQMELTSEFVDAYKRREAKRLFLRPVFLVLQKNEVLQTEAMTDWTNILDFDPSDNEEDNDSYSEDSDGGKFADRESGDRDSDNEQDFTTTNLLEEDAMDGAEEDANSQIGSELTSEGRNSRDQSYCP
ncbi:uncharacterized protein ARMOST_06607 [Armillaria ostoyae]|uniref:JmjC domain-containing protein n=1 Tax=Armillaria ostoyae TaxID=47428 RepID=A0A284R3J4_ARMOS|nr:uncharacterized protein ARMOST_06607 [Armillaria ostoyae]